MDYSEIAAYTEGLLSESPEWEKRYGGYYQSITGQSHYKSICVRCFNAKAMTKYMTVRDAMKKGQTIIDLRFLGHSIGKIKVVMTEKIINAIDKAEAVPYDLVYASSSVSFNASGLKKILPKLQEREKKMLSDSIDVLCGREKTWGWHCDEVQALRNILYKIQKNNNYSIITEHTVETLMLRQLRKHTSANKNLIGIQPCLLDGCFYQLCTPLAASEAKSDIIRYVKGNGGGIDILARIKHKQELCVIELKDEYTHDERPVKAIKQAIAYAVFLDALIRSEKACGRGWYREMFGVNLSPDKPIVINAVAAMPFCGGSERLSEEDENLAGQEIPLANGDTIRLHYMFFKKGALNASELVPGGIVTSLPITAK